MDCCKQLLILSILFSVANMVIGGGSGEPWSVCSRTCGVGIMQRSIPYQKNESDGTKKEFRACNVKSCPDGNTDFRTEQCKKFGEELTPFINKSDPCKLLCSSPEQSAIQKGLVVDGTSCSSHGVCVSGECVPFGCDRVLGSKKTINKCGTCSDLCVQLPCNLMNIGSHDYLITLSYESVNITITLGAPTCSFKAINDSTRTEDFTTNQSDISISGTVFTISDNELTADGPLDSPVTIKFHCSHKIHCKHHVSVHIPSRGLGISNHYGWTLGENFTPCSQTCGRGIQVQEIYCRELGTNKRVANSYCSNQPQIGLFPTNRFCTQPASCLSKWMHSKWMPCSKSCGGGYKRRNISCVQVYRDGIEPLLTPGECGNETKPVQQHECNKHPCQVHWHAGEWSKCSVECGEGSQTRNATCRDANGNEIDKHNCSSKEEPPSRERTCTGEMCLYKWITSNWTNCSVSCGRGVQTRLVYCTKNGTVVNKNICLVNIPNTKPLGEQICQGPHCNGKWAVQNWIKTCIANGCHDIGVQYRNIYCIYNGKTDVQYPYIKCSQATKPSNTRGCYKVEGCNPKWYKTDWDSCSGTCNGVKRRVIECKLGNVTHADERCPSERPSVIENCGPKCNFSELCEMMFCNSSYDLSQCHINCCKKCEIDLPTADNYLKHAVCARPCCLGEQQWRKKGPCL